MNKRQRIQGALRGEPVDRLPLSLWRHYHREDRTPEGLAAATLHLVREYDLDLVKLTPSGLYAVEDWAGSCIVYPGTDHEPPFLRTPAVTDPANWRRLSALDPNRGALGRELAAIRLVVAQLAGEMPLIMTVFSPLTLALKLAGETIVEQVRSHPAELHVGLATIADTTAQFAQAALDVGADELFFATQLASSRWLTRSEYDEFGQRYDRMVLDAVAERSAITVLHLHGREVFFDLANQYPVHAVTWHDQETAPSLAEARHHTDRAFVTGLDRSRLEHGPAMAIRAQAREAVAQTAGRGLILAPSCVIPTTARLEHLQAIRQAIAETQ